MIGRIFSSGFRLPLGDTPPFSDPRLLYLVTAPVTPNLEGVNELRLLGCDLQSPDARVAFQAAPPAVTAGDSGDPSDSADSADSEAAAVAWAARPARRLPTSRWIESS